MLADINRKNAIQCNVKKEITSRIYVCRHQSEECNLQSRATNHHDIPPRASMYRDSPYNSPQTPLGRPYIICMQGVPYSAILPRCFLWGYSVSQSPPRPYIRMPTLGPFLPTLGPFLPHCTMRTLTHKVPSLWDYSSSSLLTVSNPRLLQEFHDLRARVCTIFFTQ